MSLVIDRVTASRLGIAPTTIDNTLYDAFGQRQINTMYTQLNQYHVILEAQPQFQLDPEHAEPSLHPGERIVRDDGRGRFDLVRGIGINFGGIECLTTACAYTPSANTLTPTNALSTDGIDPAPTRRNDDNSTTRATPFR